jgi:hypothetical protein
MPSTELPANVRTREHRNCAFMKSQLHHPFTPDRIGCSG